MEENKQKIIDSAIKLIEKYGNNLEKLTVREISKDAGVAVGLVNYYFNSKENLIEFCVQHIIQNIIVRFKTMISDTTEKDSFKRLEELSLLTLSYLFEHSAFSSISILSDLKRCNPKNNTSMTYKAYIPLVRACRLDLDDVQIKRKTFFLVAAMQHIFLKADSVKEEFGYDMRNENERREFHQVVLRDIIM